MKFPKIAITGLSLLSVFVFCSQTTKKQTDRDRSQKTYYPSGKLKLEMFLDSNNALVRTVIYYESGTRQSDCYKNGPSTYFYENGDTLMYHYTSNGVPEGRAYSYFQNGKPAFEKFYAEGFKTGTWRYYNEDGSLREEDIYQKHMSPANSSDFSDNKYYYQNRLAYTVAVRDNKGTDTVVLDKEAFEALKPRVMPDGKTLFQVHCSMCHALSKDVVGPMMKGVTKRRKQEWLIKMITNAPQLIGSGDEEAVTLFNKWNRTQHPDYTETLSSAQVLLIIEYLKTAN